MSSLLYSADTAIATLCHTASGSEQQISQTYTFFSLLTKTLRLGTKERLSDRPVLLDFGSRAGLYSGLGSQLPLSRRLKCGASFAVDMEVKSVL